MGDSILPKRGDTGASVAERLTRSIRQGALAPGQRLIEAELTRELGVSRGPLREAFRRLDAEGLIEIIPNRGAIVRRLSFREALELFEIRTELEAYAARKAAERIDDPCIRARFIRAIAPIAVPGKRRNIAAYLEENRQFHEAILDAADNRQLLGLDRQLQLSLILAQIGPALTTDAIARSLAEHHDIAKAILAGKRKTAARAIRAHLGRASALIASLPGHVFRRDDLRTGER